MGNKKQWFANISILVIILGLTFYAIFKDENPREILRLLDRANGWYWIACLGLVVLFVSCESLILRLMLRDVGAPPPKGHCLIYSFIGFFFSCITPAAGGGQPAQVYAMHMDGLNPGITTPILMIVTICYKLVLVLYGIVVAFSRPDEIFMAHDAALYWCIIGWFMNVVIILVLLMLVFEPTIVERIAWKLMKWASRFIKPERLEKWNEKLHHTIGKYQEVTAYIKQHPKMFVIVILISILQRSILFSITWFVLRSFGIKDVSFVAILCMQCMVSLGTDLLPLPGSSGANEALFLLLFTGICGETLVLPVLIVSRGISYFGQILICGTVSLTALICFKRKRGKT